jgi:ribosomal protein L16/L10AE
VAKNIGCTRGLLATLVCLSAEMRYVYGVHHEARQFTDMAGAKMRMGKGKGSFDHWAARIAINQVVFEIKGILHEQVIRDAFRLAGNKLPGTEFPHTVNSQLLTVI